MTDIVQPKQRRGFACMSLEQRTAIAAKGGAAVPAHRRAYAMDRDLAASAGAVGGRKSRGGGRRPKAAPIEAA